MREDVKFIIGIQSHEHLPVGTKVYPSIQITLDGRSHSDPWAPLTTVPHFGDWTAAQQLGISLSFEYPRQMPKTSYLHSDSPRIRDSNVSGSLSSYTQAIAVKNYLEQRVTPRNHSFIPDYRVARVKDLVIDHLNQTLTIRDRVPPTNNTLKYTLGPHLISAHHATAATLSESIPTPRISPVLIPEMELVPSASASATIALGHQPISSCPQPAIASEMLSCTTGDVSPMPFARTLTR